jgi:uncharacterized repeat protein (TIGR01451 family)
VSVTDEVPANVTGFSAASINFPAGAINNSTYGSTGENGTGFLNITSINVPANGSVELSFDVQVAAGLMPGETIDNMATVDNPAGADATPSAPQVVVSQSQIPGAGTKPLYLWSSPARSLSRTPPSGFHTPVNINGSGGSATWVMTPSLQTALTLQPGSFVARLWLTESGNRSSRTVAVTLVNSSAGVIASSSQTLSLDDSNTTQSIFTFNLSSALTVPAGSTFSIIVTNNTPQSGRDINVFPVSGSNISRVELQSATVIKVESVQTYNAPYPGGTLTSNFTRGSIAYVRAVVSDPFGSFDISSASLSMLDPASNTTLNNVAMTQAFDSGAATLIYEYAFSVPADAPLGAWTPRVLAREGTENTVTDLGVGAFNVVMPSLAIQKLSEVLSDPQNGVSNPKRIPGSLVRYSISVANTGSGAVDPGTLVVADAIPTNLTMYADTSSGSPVEFLNGPTLSGLTFTYADDVRYSNQPGGGPPYTYTPSPDANGFDPNITGVRIAPSGSMNGAAGANVPSFTLRFVVKVR